MISVIVPVYNVEKYLSRCIDSILNQTYKDFEIILFDDGSKDNSGKICDEYAAKNRNIKVIHSENVGPSDARNFARKKAQGDYVTYIDSDDMINNQFLEILMKLIIENNADISCCGFSFFDDSSENFIDKKQELIECMSGTYAAAEILYGKKHGTSACAFLLTKEIADNNPFASGKYHEDDLISFKFCISANKVVFTSKKLYFYYQRTGSIMHSPYGKIAIDELDAADYIVQNCKQYDECVKNASIVKKYCNYGHVLITYPEIKKLDKSNYDRIKKELKPISKEVFKNKNASKRLRLSAIINYLFGINIMLCIFKRLGL
jgi:raffinose-raffinose alpha-galactotransferase